MAPVFSAQLLAEACLGLMLAPFQSSRRPGKLLKLVVWVWGIGWGRRDVSSGLDSRVTRACYALSTPRLTQRVDPDLVDHVEHPVDATSRVRGSS